MTSSDEEITIFLVKIPPTLYLITFGLYKSVFGSAKIIASILAASADRIMAPMFPGFSIPSITKISGSLFLKMSEFKSIYLDLAMAIIPSVDSL